MTATIRPKTADTPEVAARASREREHGVDEVRAVPARALGQPAGLGGVEGQERQEGDEMKNRLDSTSRTLDRIEVARLDQSSGVGGGLTMASLWSAPTPRSFSPSPMSAT